MKNNLVVFIFILVLVSACSSVVDVTKKENGSKISSHNYKDKIATLNYSAGELTGQDSLRNKIAKSIAEASQQSLDALIFSSNDIPQLLLNSPIGNLSFINNIQYAAGLATDNNLNFIVEINIGALTKNNLTPAQKNIIKENIHSIVKSCDLNGYYFTGINYLSKDDTNLFEDIIVESLLIKPFLIISTPGKPGETNPALVNEYLKKGIIDFLLAEQDGYSIQQNEYLSANVDGRILGNYLKRLSPDHFVKLNFSGMIDKDDINVEILSENRIKPIDSKMNLSFITTEKNDTLKLKIGNDRYNISKSDWAIPYDYLLNKDKTVNRRGSWVEFRRPFAKISNKDEYNLLCRTNYPSLAFINGDSVKVYKTGVFFKKIKLKEGLNKLRAEVKADNGETAVYEDRVLFVKQDLSKVDSKLTINENAIEPANDITLIPEDFLTVSFNGTKSQKGFVEINPGTVLLECNRTDYNSFSQYRIQIPLKKFSLDQKYNIKLIMRSAKNDYAQNSVEKVLTQNLIIRDYSDFPSLTTISDNSILTFTLAPIRLGAPLRNELPKNVILKSNGIIGDNYRVRLSDTEEGYINKEFVKELPATTIVPSYFINPITSYPAENADIVKIPYLENVPYDIYPDPAQKRIIINLYGVKTSSTWIIHRNDLRYIEEITWQQTSKETYKIFVNLKTSKIWGYDIKPNGKELILRIKYPPIYNLENSLPLKGIKFSIEAGHGGSGIGAVGLSGLKEKEINLKLSKILEVLLEKNGAEVLQVRDSDKDMSLTEKRDIVTNSDANIHLSIHANASDPENEFLGTSGTCTFYNNPFWANLAEKIYKRLIELDLKPFGSVGSFNYRVTRMSNMPAILVEQAFMSHAEDEEKLFDDNFRQQMAEKIYNGIIDYLKYMKD